MADSLITSPAGLSVLTGVGQASSLSASNAWSGVADAFSRVAGETNTIAHRTTYGRVNGPSTVTASLDGQPVPATVFRTADSNWTNQWRSNIELTPGAHQLVVSATLPSGLATTNASAWFTNSAANETVSDAFDAAGQITQRLWKGPSGSTNRTQSLSWDARGRLSKVSDRDSSTNGYDWTAAYDALGRRLQTVTTLVTNGVAINSQPSTISQFYDPLVEFLELGLSVDGQTTWKLYGPDLDGTYGAMNGTGGLDAIIPDPLQFWSTIADARGNILGYAQNYTSMLWNSSRPTGYGAVSGYRPPPLAKGVSVATSAAWRGRWPDVTGYLWLGARYYNPEAGNWLSSDPMWNGKDPNYFTFCGGDPINGFDADGRCASAAYQTVGQYAQGITGLANNIYYSASYGVASLVYGRDQADQWYGQSWQGLKQTVGGAAQTAYDVAAFASFELLSPIAPEASAQAYGPSVERLYNLDNALTGGQGNSATYRATATIANAGLLVLGGEFGNLGRASEVSKLAPTVYSVAFQMQLDATEFGLKRPAQFQIANEALQAERAVNPALAELVPAPVGWGRPPADWTWQHATIDQGGGVAGVMQLVPRAQHTAGSPFWPLFHPLPGGGGGYTQWAIPAGAPPN